MLLFMAITVITIADIMEYRQGSDTFTHVDIYPYEWVFHIQSDQNTSSQIEETVPSNQLFERGTYISSRSL